LRLGLGAGAVIGTIAYELILRLLTAWNVAVWHDGRNGVRDVAVWLVVAAAAVFTIVAYRRRPSVVVRRAVVAGLLLAGGAAWVGLGAMDQHLLRLFDISPASNPLLWDAVWHGAGAVTAGVGWMLWTDTVAVK
jgi:uncharacterized membrane protein